MPHSACASVSTTRARASTSTAPLAIATADEVEGALDHWREVLVQIGFLDPGTPKRLMPRLQQLLNRARLTREEVHILRGIARAAAREPRDAQRR